MLINVVSPLTLSVPVIGPPNGRGVERLVVRLSGVHCSADCTTRRWNLRVGRLGVDGYARRRRGRPAG
jgi:hypothetical protein